MTTSNTSPKLTGNPAVYLTEPATQGNVDTTVQKISDFTLPAIGQINSPLFLHLPTPQETFLPFEMAQSCFGLTSPMNEDPLADLRPEFSVYSSKHLHDESDEEGKGSPPKRTKFDTPSSKSQLSSPTNTPVRRPRPVKLSFSSPHTPLQAATPEERQDSDSEGVFTSPSKKAKFDTAPSLHLPAAHPETETLRPARLHFHEEAAIIEPESAESSPIKTIAVEESESGSAESSPIKTIAVEPSESGSGSETENSPPKKIVREALPRATVRPGLKIQLNLAKELDEAALPVVKHVEEFHWMNRLVEPRVLGRNLNEREERFVQQVYEAVGMSHTFSNANIKLGIQHLQRGTYFIRTMHTALFELLSNKTVAKCIAEYYSNDRAPLETLLNLNTFPIGVFKPADEVRGAPNEKKGSNNPAKQGVEPRLEIINELAAAGLSNLEQVVVGMSLTDPNFYDLATNEAGKKAKTKFGAAISFLPMASLTKIHDKTVLDRALSTLPIEDFQDIAILDITLCNADRNADNIMLSTEALAKFTNSQPGVNPSLQPGELSPIDHANILPAGFLSPGNFAWMNWEIAHQPFTESAKRKIASLNAQEDIAKIVKLYPNYPEANLEILEITYNLLKQAAVSNFTPFQIGLLFAAENENPSLLMNLFLTAKEHQALIPPAVRPSMSDMMVPCIMKALAYATKYDLNNSREVWDASFSDIMQKAKTVLKE